MQRLTSFFRFVFQPQFFPPLFPLFLPYSVFLVSDESPSFFLHSLDPHFFFSSSVFLFVVVTQWHPFDFFYFFPPGNLSSGRLILIPHPRGACWSVPYILNIFFPLVAPARLVLYSFGQMSTLFDLYRPRAP